MSAKPKRSTNPKAAKLKKRRESPSKQRLDVLVFERGLAPSRQRAQAMLLAGQIRVDDRPESKAGTMVAREARIEVVGEALRYASRGGLKLEGALDDFGASVEGKVCLDVGSSTGGFTDCLLQRGARRVYAVDVNVRQLAWKLQQDSRVVPMKLNARYLKPANVGEAVELVTVDVSFISVSKLLPALVTVARPDGEFLILIKPQFELERRDVGKGGIVRDPQLHQEAVRRITAAAERSGLEALAVQPSHLPGSEGNQEFFLHARRRRVE